MTLVNDAHPPSSYLSLRFLSGRQRDSAAMAFLATLAPFLIFSSFVLLLLVTLSAPIIKPIYLFRLFSDVGGSAASASGGVNFGVFGYCVSSTRYSYASQGLLCQSHIIHLCPSSVLGVSGSTGGSCSTPRLGYTFDSTVTQLLCVLPLALLRIVPHALQIIGVVMT